MRAARWAVLDAEERMSRTRRDVFRLLVMVGIVAAGMTLGQAPAAAEEQAFPAAPLTVP